MPVRHAAARRQYRQPHEAEHKEEHAEFVAFLVIAVVPCELAAVEGTDDLGQHEEQAAGAGRFIGGRPATCWEFAVVTSEAQRAPNVGGIIGN